MADTSVLVTAYENPDLDGTASAFAFAELLRRQGQNATAGVFGTPDRESRFVFQRFGIPMPVSGGGILATCTSIIIVDASDLRGLSHHIDPSRVVKVIDHREVHEARSFPNAEIQIELVGAAATLIAERYWQTKIPISRESALLLFFAIVSNTVNFKARVTTPRDIAMAEWLRDLFKIPTTVVGEMFAFKSDLDKPLKDVLRNDVLATFTFDGQTVGIAQLELTKSGQFVEAHLCEIEEALVEIKQEKSLDMVFLTCIDVDEGFNRIVASDATSRDLLERALSLLFVQNVAKTDRIIMRKEMVPVLKQSLVLNSELRR